MSDEEALLGGVLDAAVDAIILSDSSGKITRTNRAAEQLFGYKTSELIDQSVNILMPEVFASLHDSFMAHHIKTGEKRIIDIGRDVEGLRKDGSVFPLHLSVGRALVNGELAFIGILHDLTARKATEEALARSQRLDAIGQMTGGISHDFNNLLTVIIGNLELLEMRTDDPKLEPLLRDALEAAELGADLTSQLMVFARRADLKPTILNLNEACTSTLSLLKRTMGEMYRITTNFSPDIASVAIDPTQLHTAIANLALNAKDAMPNGGELTISTENIEIDDSYIAQETDIERGKYVRLSVTDTGQGMSAEAQKRAFEPFFTTKTSQEGTGLGLAMVYGFVRQSGGHITVYSELDYGTSFGLYFPVLASTSGNFQSRGGEENEALVGNGQVVLVVEDNPKVRALSLERIIELGYQTLEAENGDMAYSMILENPDIDLVFSDIMMPGTLNGHALAKRIRAEFPNIKILLTSGYSSDLLSTKTPKEAAFELIRKPFRQRDLAIKLQALLIDG